MLVDELNLLRQWQMDLKAASAGANSLPQLKAAIAGLSNMPQRNMGQVKPAIKNKINSTDIDE